MKLLRPQDAGAYEADSNDLARMGLAAFTRVEATVLTAMVGLLLAVVLPALAHDRTRSSRIACANNLRQIGVASQLWGNDRGDRPPWEIPVNQGGTLQHTLSGNAWLHFASMSNELASPRILLCPSDTGRLATEFSSSADGGFLNPNHRNNSVSYFLTHAFQNGQFSMFAGDRNFLTLAGSGTCSRFPTVSFANVNSPLGWDTNLHNRAGNIVRLDGRVNQYSDTELNAAVRGDPLSDSVGIDDGSRSFHILKPR